MATFKERVLQKAKDIEKQLAERELLLEKERKFKHQYRNDVFTAVQKELRELQNLTVHTNLPFFIKLNLTDHTLETPCGKLFYLPTCRVLGSAVLTDNYSFVDCDGKQTSLTISYDLEQKASEVQDLLLLFEDCIAKHLRLAK